MADARQKFGTSTAFTITLASLAAGASRQSTAVDLETYSGSNPITDVMIGGFIKLATGTPGSTRSVNVYIAGSEDGTNYGADVGATDAAYTPRSPSNLVSLRTISVPDSGGLTYRMMPNAVAQFFGGVLPRKIVLVVQNDSNLAFDSTGSNHAFTYTPVYPNLA